MKKIFTVLALSTAVFAAIRPAAAQEIGTAAVESAADVRVQDEVLNRLDADHRLDSALFTVSVHDGHVSIIGTLRDESQRTEMYRVARAVPGAHDVFVLAQEDTQ